MKNKRYTNHRESLAKFSMLLFGMAILALMIYEGAKWIIQNLN